MSAETRESPRMTLEELVALPVAVDVPTAGRAFGFGRDKSYALARAGEFPCPVLQRGHEYRVTKAVLMRSLGLNLDGTLIPEPAGPENAAGQESAA